MVGYVIKTSDGVVGISGTPKLVYGMHMISGGTAGNVILRNGTSAGAGAVISMTGTINVGVTMTFGVEGVVFPAGCFCDVDANVSSVVVFYKEL